MYASVEHTRYFGNCWQDAKTNEYRMKRKLRHIGQIGLWAKKHYKNDGARWGNKTGQDKDTVRTPEKVKVITMFWKFALFWWLKSELPRPAPVDNVVPAELQLKRITPRRRNRKQSETHLLRRVNHPPVKSSKLPIHSINCASDSKDLMKCLITVHKKSFFGNSEPALRIILYY